MFPSGELVFKAAESTVSDRFEGGFAKNILILALAEENSVANRAFIAKVLSAANLDLAADACFAEISEAEPVNCFSGFPERPKYILAFGLPPTQIGFSAAIQPYEALHFHGVHWLFADSISILEPDRDKKGKLWTALKTLFL